MAVRSRFRGWPRPERVFGALDIDTPIDIRVPMPDDDGYPSRKEWRVTLEATALATSQVPEGVDEAGEKSSRTFVRVNAIITAKGSQIDKAPQVKSQLILATITLLSAEVPRAR
jgi:hypothetical protein